MKIENRWATAVACVMISLAIVMIILVGLGLIVGPCFGAALVGAHPSCPRVVNHLGSRSFPCSGVLIWKSDKVDAAQVVTAAHLFTDGVGIVKVHCVDNKVYLANVVHIDRRHDFAILHIRRPLCRAVCFAVRLPVAGARLLLGGYPHGGRFRWHGGILTRIDRDGSLITGALSQPGDSGGPILNEKNELVGLIALTHNPATCPNRPNCQDGVSTGGPSAMMIAAAAKKYQALAEQPPDT